MGGRRKTKQRVVKEKKPTVAKIFDCPFCNHQQSVECKIEREKQVGTVRCRICDASYQTTIHYLTEPIDVYSEWIDECEAQNKPENVETILGSRGAREEPEERPARPAHVAAAARSNSSKKKPEAKAVARGAAAAAAAKPPEYADEEEELPQVPIRRRDDGFVVKEEKQARSQPEEEEAPPQAEEEEEEIHAHRRRPRDLAEPQQQLAQPAAAAPVVKQEPVQLQQFQQYEPQALGGLAQGQESEGPSLKRRRVEGEYRPAEGKEAAEGSSSEDEESGEGSEGDESGSGSDSDESSEDESGSSDEEEEDRDLQEDMEFLQADPAARDMDLDAPIATRSRKRKQPGAEPGDYQLPRSKISEIADEED